MTSAKPRFIRKITHAGAKGPIVRTLVWLGILTVLVAVVGFVWLGWWDIAQNRRILSSLPLPPGTERIERESHSVATKDNILYPPEYWSTSATFTIPGYSREYLLDFYITRLSPEWEYCIRVFTPGVRLVRDHHTVSLSTEGASSPTGGGSFRIHIAPDGGKASCG